MSLPFRRRSLRTRPPLPLVGLLLLPGLLAAGGCARPYRFRATDPVLILDDQRPIAIPRPRRYRHAQNLARELVEQPALEALDVSRVPPSGDVNSLDEVPASSWFTPRLGYRPVSPEELLRGPTKVGPPELPLTVVKAKSGGANPGFIVADARGERYLVKFDPPDFPAIETTTALVVNRLFWGFGYNVPEDFLLFFRPEELHVAPGGGLTPADVASVLAEVAAPLDGRYRCTASLLVDGVVVGPVAGRGVRNDDPNDTIPHEDRRVLRALRVFGAFVNHTDIRPDNSLSTYVGAPGQGHLVHYLLDFGEAFGGHGAEHGRLWDGFEHLFSYRSTGRRLVTLGLRVEDWERVGATPWRSVGYFEADEFQPAEWRETAPFPPIRRALPADDYWAAKILAALTREHVETLVRAAEYPEPGAGDYVVETLMKRREKVLRFAFSRVAALEPVEVRGDEIRLSDLGRAQFPDAADLAATRFEIRLIDGEGRTVEEREIPAGDSAELIVRSPHLGGIAAHGYLRVRITARRSAGDGPPPLELHLVPGDAGAPRLVGIVR